MCGIAGVIEISPASGHLTAAERLARMLPALARRGPDGEGNWISPDGRIALGHRRLAVIAPGARGDQPMSSVSGRWVIVFNGCIYNFRELAAELRVAHEESSADARHLSDTAVLIDAIERWGVEATLPRLDGMFAFAAFDTVTGSVLLARDRFGEKPLYVAALRSDARGGSTNVRPLAGWAWASDLAAFEDDEAIDRDLDDEAVLSVLRWGFVAHPRTVWSGVEQVAPGGLVEIAGDGLVVRRQWSDPWERSRHSSPCDPVEARQRVLSALRTSVRARLVSDVPLGAFLSGGIDSTLVCALAQAEQRLGPLRTFTVAIPEAGLDESPTAIATAQHLGTEHTTVRLSEHEALEMVPDLAVMWSEPFADPSMLPTAMLCRAVRSDVTVALSGDGGDEVFGGYNRHVAGPRLAARLGRIPAPLLGIGARIGRAVPPGVWAAALTPFVRVPGAGVKAHKALSLAAALGAGADGSGAALFATFAGVWDRASLRGDPPDPLSGRKLPDDPFDALLVADGAAVLPDDMLVKLDRASMAFGLEVRAPFLAAEVVDTAWDLPREHLVRGHIGKAVLRDIVDGLVPGVAGQPKVGFDPPLDRWLRGPLRQWAGDLLAPSALAAAGLDRWIDPHAVERVWNEHQRGRANHGYRLWAVLMLAVWIERWVR